MESKKSHNLKNNNSQVIYLKSQSQGLLRQVLSSLPLTKIAEQITLPMQESENSGKQRFKKILTHSRTESTEDHIKNKSNKTEVLQKAHCRRWREKSKPVLSSRKTKAKLVTCTWEERSTRVVSGFSVSLMSLSAAKEKLVWKPCTELAFSSWIQQMWGKSHYKETGTIK